MTPFNKPLLCGWVDEMLNCPSPESASCGQMILKLSSEMQHCTEGRKTLTSNQANNSQQGICWVNVSEVPVNSLKLLTTGLDFSWQVVGREFCWGFFCLLSEFQVHSDGRCRLWHMFLSPNDPNKTLQRICAERGLSVAGRTVQWGSIIVLRG